MIAALRMRGGRAGHADVVSIAVAKTSAVCTTPVSIAAVSRAMVLVHINIHAHAHMYMLHISIAAPGRRQLATQVF